MLSGILFLSWRKSKVHGAWSSCKIISRATTQRNFKENIKRHLILLLRDKSYESNILACQHCCLLWLRNRHPLRRDPVLSKSEYIRRLRSFLFWQPDPSPPFLLPGRGLLKFLFAFVLDQCFHLFWLWSGWACHQIQWLQEKAWSFSRLREAPFCDITCFENLFS